MHSVRLEAVAVRGVPADESVLSSGYAAHALDNAARFTVDDVLDSLTPERGHVRGETAKDQPGEFFKTSMLISALAVSLGKLAVLVLFTLT
jgi:hypothetical protein